MKEGRKEGTKNRQHGGSQEDSQDQGHEIIYSLCTHSSVYSSWLKINKLIYFARNSGTPIFPRILQTFFSIMDMELVLNYFHNALKMSSF